MNKNKLLISAAGSGKTTFIVDDALGKSDNILITTYTEANEAEIKRKIIKVNKCIPSNITIQTWFSFLIQHGIRPFQGSLFEHNVKGLILVNDPSGIWFVNKKGIRIPYSEESEFYKHYFTEDGKIYSDKLAKLVIRCNKNSKGDTIGRIAKIFKHLYIDEVQDLAGYDLDIILELFKSKSEITLVGDPRQVTYLTHHENKYSQFKDGQIERFVLEKCKRLLVEIDKTTLQRSHRNNKELCDFSSRLYPNLPYTESCDCSECRREKSDHNGVFIVRPADVNSYKSVYQPVELRYREARSGEWNIGKSKGLGFERVLIHPTDTFISYLKTGQLIKNDHGKVKAAFDIPKLYVALTRARHSAAIVYDYKDDEQFISGVNKYN